MRATLALRPLVALATLLVLAVGACSDDDSSSETLGEGSGGPNTVRIGPRKSTTASAWAAVIVAFACSKSLARLHSSRAAASPASWANRTFGEFAEALP